jgi:hypothetical protein
MNTTTAVRRSAALAAIAVAGLTGAGCGADGASGTGGGGATQATAQAKAVKFSECIRAHGVADFPDPDAKGEFEYGVSVSGTVWTKAVRACKALQPAGSLSSQRNPKQQSEGLTFAKCVRAHGVEDFPDPADGEPLIDTNKIPSSARPGGMTILNAAIGRCRKPLADAAAGQ